MGRRSKKKAAYRSAAQQAAGRPANPVPLWRSSAWKLGVAGIGMLLVGDLIALLVLSSSSEELSKETGKVAPGFELRTIGGERFTLAEQRGSVVVLEFLEPGCPSCTVDVAGLSEIAAGGEVGAAVLIADVGGLGPGSLRDYYHGQLGASARAQDRPGLRLQGRPGVRGHRAGRDGGHRPRGPGELEGDLEWRPGEHPRADRGGRRVSEAAIFAFGAGVVATVNPCGFAMLPSFLAFYLGDGEGAAAERGLLARWGGGFAVGLVLSAAFASVFVVAGVVVSIGIRELLDVVPWVAAAIGAILLALGVAMLAGRHVGLTAADRVRVDRGASHGYRRVALFGIGYALASLSCTLAVFLIVAGQASTVGDPLGMAAVFAAFAAGAATVLVAVCLSAALARGALVRALRRALPLANRLAGGYWPLPASTCWSTGCHCCSTRARPGLSSSRSAIGSRPRSRASSPSTPRCSSSPSRLCRRWVSRCGPWPGASLSQ